jgi:Cu+-exporting ATPase
MKKTLIAVASLAVALGLNSTAADADKKQPAAAAKAKVKDPVCGMMIDPATAAAKSEYNGKTYYFCSPDEKPKFDKDPAQYVKPVSEKKKA